MSAKPTAEQTAILAPSDTKASGLRKALIAIVGLAVWPVLQFGGDGQLNSAGLGAALAVLGFIVAIITFRAALAVVYSGQARLLVGGIVAGLIAGVVAVPQNLWWPMTFMTLALGTAPMLASGNLRRFAGHERSFVAGTIGLLVLGTVAYLPLWPELMELAAGFGPQIVEQEKAYLVQMGYSPDLIGTYAEAVQWGFNLLVRMIPASMLIGLMVQFTVGYLWFSARESRSALVLPGPAPFVRWKMPYALLFAAVAALLGRLLGGENVQLWSDNALIILAVLYGVAGLAVIEHYQRWFGFPPILRFLFYVLLLVSQVIGFTFAVLLGFMDSFFDWRKIDASQSTPKKNVFNNRNDEVEDESHSS